MKNFLDAIGALILSALTELGRVMLLLGQVLGWLVRPPYRFDQLMKQFEFVGVDSMSVILLTGGFSGAVMALQMGYAFSLFDADAMVGPAVALAITRELGPVFTALMVASRCGSSMAAEIGTMKVTEQIDALETMAVNTVQYLIVPRVLASFIMLPLLTAVFDFIGIVGSAIVTISLMDVPFNQFYDLVLTYLDMEDLFNGLIKAAVFGIIIALISCYKGFYTTRGAAGVGRATTESVVWSSVTVLISDYFLTAILF